MEQDQCEARSFGTPDAGLAQVLAQGASRPCGMAFLVAPRLAVTCAHVVNVALGREKYDRRPVDTDACVDLQFPLADDLVQPSGDIGRPKRTARILRFKPPGRRPTDDIALLALQDAAPFEVGQTALADVRGVPLDGDPLGVFGPSTGAAGVVVHFDARFSGNINPSWTQIDSTSGREDFVRPGFSGGRVWDFTHDAAIGMVVGVQQGEGQGRAFMIPAAAIRRFLPDLPGEVRRCGAGFCALWTGFAALWLLLVLTHFLGGRIGDYPSALALGNGNSVVNAFFGLNINALLMPIGLAMLLRFTEGYREHPWWMRMPQFGRFRIPARPTASRWGAVLALVMFVVVPLYMQGHFMLAFRDDGTVYIYPDDFGYNAGELRASGQHCFNPSLERCEHPQAGRLSLVKPRPGAKGGYWENAYHYGDLSLRKPNSVTFFPVAQPLAIASLSLASLVLAGMLVLRVFRRPSRIAADGLASPSAGV